MATLSNDGLKQQSFRTLGSTTSTWNGDAIAGMIANESGLAAKSFNGRMDEWLTAKGQNELNVQGKMNGFAVAQGFTSWNNMTSFTIS
tara:strand:+ start:444 stop:707 length:264 start_codon:yes stop_codon:yes gene_type:complete